MSRRRVRAQLTPSCHSEYPHPIFTIGHSTRTLAEFIALLDDVQADLVVDVRSIPRSRTNPQFNIDALPEALGAVGKGYRHLLALGGTTRSAVTTVLACLRNLPLL